MVAIAQGSWTPPQESTKPALISSSDQGNLSLIASPFGIRIDNQEKAGWNFSCIPADKSKSKGKPSLFAIPVICDSHLKFGDYAIIGLEDHFRIERKSKEDMYGTVAAFHSHASDEKKKVKINPLYEAAEHWFARQLEGLNSINGFGHVVVECTFTDLLIPPSNTKFTSKSVVRTIMSWMQRYPQIHWHFPGGKRVCEIFVYQIMSKAFDHFNRKDS